MSEKFHNAVTRLAATDDASTRVHPVALDDRFGPLVAWMEQLASSLAKAGEVTQLQNCERFIGELKRSSRADTEAMGPSPSATREVLGAMTAVVRALHAGDLPLTDSLRAELVELVRELSGLVSEPAPAPGPETPEPADSDPAQPVSAAHDAASGRER